MTPVLSENEARIIGCLIEKSVVTPDQYPLTLNALTNACNQKSARNPVMALQQGVVQRTVRDLEGKNLLRVDESFKSRTEKYVQRFCNSRYSDFQFDEPQLAVVCLLLLRGPQTPGELKSRSGRLHAFADNAAVTDTLDSLIDRDGDPLVVKLPRTPGRKDSEFMHLFCGPVDVETHVAEAAAVASTRSASRTDIAELEERIQRLEAEVIDLRRRIETST